MSSKPSKKTCLITGATGFVGLNLIEALVNDSSTKWRILAVARPQSSRISTLFEYLPNNVSSQIEIVKADLIIEDSLQDALQHVSTIHIVFHLTHIRETTVHPGRVWAAMGHTPEGADDHIRLNVQTMDRVLHVSSLKQVKRVIYCSSWSSYGVQPPGTMVDEVTTRRLANQPIALGFLGSNPHPIPYAMAKSQCENKLQQAIRQGQIKGGVILQPCTIFGPYSKSDWSSFFQRLYKTNGNIPGLPGASSFIDARDLARAFVSATIEGDGQGEAYVLGGTNASHLDMIQIMAQMVGVPAPIQAPTASRLLAIARWNEWCLQSLPLSLLPYLQIQPHAIACPLLVAKLCQSQGTHSLRAQNVLGYTPRSLEQLLQGNYQWLVQAGILLPNNNNHNNNNNLRLRTRWINQ